MSKEHHNPDVAEILKIIDELNTLKDVDTILDRILTESRRLSGADAGSIFLIPEDELVFSYVQNDTLYDHATGRAALYQDLKVPMTHDSIVGHTALIRKPVNIPDAYNLDPEVPFRFNTSFDEEYGYRTVSILAIPLLTIEERLLGVMQLINARDDEGNTVPFSEEDQTIVSLFANNAAVTIERGIMNRELILRMMSMAELRDPAETGAHVQRVGAYSAEIYERWARKKGLREDEIKRTRDLIRLAAMLHDVGKVGIPDSILKKPGKLTEEEFDEIKKHTIYGAKLFNSITSDLDRMSLEIALNHHEKWDGCGYPGCVPELEKLPKAEGEQVKKGEAIPLTARITALADVYDALCSRRSYKDAFEEEQVYEIIRDSSGSHFDPEIVDAFFEITDVLRAIRQKYQ
ncbi:MAG: HD domain-containing protein [Desulfobulbaceae bacterium]